LEFLSTIHTAARLAMNHVADAAHAAIGRHCVLARSRWIDLCGNQVETPLLVPAISSKAVAPIPLGQRKKKPMVVVASRVHTETLVPSISEALLVSAFDIYHGFLTSSDAFRVGFAKSLYSNLRTIFIDSGWYEKNVGPSSGQWYHDVGDVTLKFELEDYIKLVESLDPQLKAVLVAWDSSGTYVEQIEVAQAFFAKHERFASSFLLKPEGARLHHDFRNLSTADAARLKFFDVVGVTEKELGDSILSRLTALANLRSRLDEARVAAPIHVFGGLDPLFTPLYFAAGGEIFDSLAWLRYAFRDGMSVSRESVGVLDKSYEKRFPVATGHVQLRNLDALAELSRELKVFFHNRGDWTKLRRGLELKPAFEAMESALGVTDGR
jgi:hypothetical protein